MTDFIQQYLDQGLFSIADNEERLQKLQTSAVTLADVFLADRDFLVQFVRASLVENADPNAAAYEKVEAHIKLDWKTIRSAHPERPIAIILAVGWQALRLAVEKQDELSSLLWYSAANLLTSERIDKRLALPISFLNDLEPIRKPLQFVA